MSGSEGRYEFRAWGRRLSDVADRIVALAECNGSLRTTEVYVVSRLEADTNPKARADTLDVKTLERVHEGFEQWRVAFKAGFPVSAEDLGARLFPLLGVEPPALGRKRYELTQLTEELVKPHPDLRAVEISKSRRFFTIADCRTEFSRVVVAGRRLATVAVESADPTVLHEACRLLGLYDKENVSYPRAIRRAIGWDEPGLRNEKVARSGERDRTEVPDQR